GADEFHGWPGDLDSLQFAASGDQVSGGYLLVWSPDDQAQFPTDFGPDDILFSTDDPLGPISAGWTVVNLNKRPFEFLRQHSVAVPIYDSFATSNDLSKLSYLQAFDTLVQILRARYAFTDYKKIDWEAIVKAIRPQVQQAEQDQRKQEFNIALLRFA